MSEPRFRPVVGVVVVVMLWLGLLLVLVVCWCFVCYYCCWYYYCHCPCSRDYCSWGYVWLLSSSVYCPCWLLRGTWLFVFVSCARRKTANARTQTCVSVSVRRVHRHTPTQGVCVEVVRGANKIKNTTRVLIVRTGRASTSSNVCVSLFAPLNVFKQHAI